MSIGRTITFVTGNAGKLSEVKAILGSNCPFNMVTSAIDLPEYQGDNNEVSEQKCKTAFSVVNGPVLVEDTSLCFEAFKGLPGPYVKWFLKAVGPEGLFKMLQGFENYNAEAVATFAYLDGVSDEVKMFQGITKGQIVSPRGSKGFGWDSCFQPTGFDETYAEMSFELKNTISHRKKAIEAMRDFFQNENSDKDSENK